MFSMTKRTRGKGFSRSAKQWEETISSHIGKSIDSGHLPDYLLNAALAYLGWEAFQDPIGLIYGPVALKLATASNVIAGAAGVVGLTLLGLSFGKQEWEHQPADVKKESGIVKEVICPPGFQKVYAYGKGWTCIRFSEGFLP